MKHPSFFSNEKKKQYEEFTLEDAGEKKQRD